jgi:S-adenosylmethionine:tRNA ribosyltransferase-isomerase
MLAAREPIQRPKDAKLLAIAADGRMTHHSRSALVGLLRPGDLVIANDAATIPASLAGIHLPTAAPIEVRLAGRPSLSPDDVHRFSAVVFGPGDWRTRTEDRAPPPPLLRGDRLVLGPLSATIEAGPGHPRLVLVAFDGSTDAIWAGIARHGRPIQYAHLRQALELWDSWTKIANRPAAFEAPSAGFALDWQLLADLSAKGIGFATLTHAAGISSTGDEALDARLPFDEPYVIPPGTVAAIGRAKAEGGRVIAIGTTVVRALEHAAGRNGRLVPGEGIATGRIGPSTPLRIIDAILSGVHEAGASHFELLRAFAADEILDAADHALNARGYRTHEFGDSIFLEKSSPRSSRHPVITRSALVAAGFLSPRK